MTTRHGWYLGMLLVLLVLGWRAPGLGHKAEEGERLSKIGPAPAFTLTAQDGRQLSLNELHGKVVVVTFIYTSCADACPLLTAKMAALQDDLGDDFGPNIFFLSITVDPERDTPEVLSRYAWAHGANLAGWAFLIGTPDDIRAVARQYGIYHRKQAGGDVDHTFLTSLVEDDPQATELLRLYLEGAGYRVEVAWDGEDGFTKACQLHPALITLDLLLPKIDGWDLLVRLKGEPATCGLPVVIVSIMDERGKGFALGAADYLVKPVSREDLLNVVQRVSLTRPRSEAATVLAIDDDPMALELVDAILSPNGFHILKASSGEEGVAIARREPPALIILDLLMPEVDGFMMVERRRADPTTAIIPIVILTSKHLTPEEKARLNGEIACLARKGEFSRGAFVEQVRGLLEPQINTDEHR